MNWSQVCWRFSTGRCPLTAPSPRVRWKNKLLYIAIYNQLFVYVIIAIVGTPPRTSDVEAVRGRSPSISSLDLSDMDLMPDAFSDKNVVRTKTFLFVADLARKGPRFHGKKSQLYMWNLLIVCILSYILLVYQND